jgi:hypothetical protein
MTVKWSRALPEHVREEVCQDVAVYVLEGAALTTELVKKAISAAYRKYPVISGHELSVDAFVAHGSKTRWVELMAS